MGLFNHRLGPGTGGAINLLAAYRVGFHKAGQRYPRDIIVKFPSWETKLKVLAAYRCNPNPVMDGKVINIYPDLSPLTGFPLNFQRFIKACDSVDIWRQAN